MNERFVNCEPPTHGYTGEKTDLDYKIQLATTPCHFGGVRYWFICPLAKNGRYCGRRTGTLYLASGGKYFGCRDCYNLSYESRNESRVGRPEVLFIFLCWKISWKKVTKKSNANIMPENLPENISRF